MVPRTKLNFLKISLVSLANRKEGRPQPSPRLKAMEKNKGIVPYHRRTGAGNLLLDIARPFHDCWDVPRSRQGRKKKGRPPDERPARKAGK